MSRRAFMLLGLGIATVGFASGAVPEPQEAAKSGNVGTQVKALQDRVASLEDRLDSLQGQLDALGSGSPRMVLRQDDSQPWLVHPRQTLPPGTQERQFNGLTYYIIPTDGSGVSAAAEAAPVTVPAR
jgi:hypothetical protein